MIRISRILWLSAVILILSGLLSGCNSEQSTKHTSEAASTGFQKLSLNGVWDFKTDPYNLGLSEQWHTAQGSPKVWDQLTVPGNWDVETNYADFTGAAWYKTEFDTPAQAKQKLVRIVFESVYNDSEIWLNGKKVGDNAFGFLPFHFDINSYLVDSGKNTLVLRVDNTFKRGAIWNWGGIRRPVWLEISQPTRLEQHRVVAIPDLNKGDANLEIELDLINTATQASDLDYQLDIYKRGEANNVLLSLTGSKSLTANDKTTIQLSANLSKEQTALWDYNHPNLYISKLTLSQNGEIMQTQKERFGIRKLEINDDKQLLLNGKVYRPLGFNLVSEDRYTGNALPLARIKEDVAIMKSLGANFARISHMPLPKAYLDVLDENGIMTFEEVALWGKDAWVDPEHPMPKQWLEKMIATKYNHPSVVGWSVGNEIGWNDKAYEYIAGAIKHAKELDPNRFAVYVSHSAHSKKDDAAIFSDLIMLNIYGNWSNALEKAHKNFPNKAIFMSEFGKVLNSELPNEGKLDAKEMVDALRYKDYTIGGALWTLNDYRSKWHGGEGWATGESQNRAWGIVNAYRQKKRAYSAFEKEYAPITELALDIDDKTQQAKFSFNARKPLDLPAYILKDYFLNWTAYDEQGQVLATEKVALPEINPDGQAYNYNWQLNTANKVVAVSVGLQDALGYTLIVEHKNLIAPIAPTNVRVINSTKKNRVVFQPSWNAAEHYVKYKHEGKWKTTKPTIGNYIELDTPKKPEQILLVATNENGEVQADYKLTIQRSEDNLPPVVLDVKATADAIFIAYDTSPYDYLYDLRIGTQSGQYERQMSFNTKGVFKLPNLKEGQTYYIQMRQRAQHGYASLWTDEYQVTVGDENSIKPTYQLELD